MNSLDITVDADTAQVSRFLRSLFKDQIPFVVSLAINETAKDFQTAQRGHMEEEFTVRRPRFTLRAVKIKPFATKRKPWARVSIDPPGGQSRADILTKFEFGGVKRARGKRIAVPQEARRTKAGVITKRQRPRSFDFELWGVGQRATVFRGSRRTWMVWTRGGTGGIFQRTGRGRTSKVKTLFTFTPRAKIDAVLEFEKTAKKTVREKWESNFRKSFRRAVETAR